MIKRENSRQVILFLSFDIICIPRSAGSRSTPGEQEVAQMIPRSLRSYIFTYLNVNGNKWHQRIARQVVYSRR